MNKWTTESTIERKKLPVINKHSKYILYSKQALQALDNHIKYLSPERGPMDTYNITFVERYSFMNNILRNRLNGLIFRYAKSKNDDVALYQYLAIVIDDYLIYVTTRQNTTLHYECKPVIYRIDGFYFISSFPNNLIYQKQTLLTPKFANKAYRIKKLYGIPSSVINTITELPISKIDFKETWIDAPKSKIYKKVKGFRTKVGNEVYYILTDSIASDKISDKILSEFMNKEVVYKEWENLFCMTHLYEKFRYSHPKLKL